MPEPAIVTPPNEPPLLVILCAPAPVKEVVPEALYEDPAMAFQSPVKLKLDKFKYKVLRLFKNYDIDTIQLDKTKEMMHDLTHMNELGASEVASKLGTLLENRQRTTIYVVILGDS